MGGGATSSAMSDNLTPVEVAATLIGGIEDLALSIGYDRKSAYPWLRASKHRAAGDFPSATVMRKLLDHSDTRDLGLTAEHLLRGASRTEIDAILSQRGQAELTATAAE